MSSNVDYETDVQRLNVQVRQLIEENRTLTTHAESLLARVADAENRHTVVLAENATPWFTRFKSTQEGTPRERC